jgi:hypothetical protein
MTHRCEVEAIPAGAQEGAALRIAVHLDGQSR